MSRICFLHEENICANQWDGGSGFAGRVFWCGKTYAFSNGSDFLGRVSPSQKPGGSGFRFSWPRVGFPGSGLSLAEMRRVGFLGRYSFKILKGRDPSTRTAPPPGAHQVGAESTSAHFAKACWLRVRILGGWGFHAPCSHTRNIIFLSFPSSRGKSFGRAQYTLLPTSVYLKSNISLLNYQKYCTVCEGIQVD